MVKGDVLEALNGIFPARDMLAGAAAEPYCHDESRHSHASAVVVFPRTHQQVVDTVNQARKTGFSLVPSGGRTGLSGGACAGEDEVVISLEKMHALEHFDQDTGEITVQAGMTIERLQQLANDAGWFYPVDYASRGSAQVGGALATNAGGIRVLRYGMTREQVWGLTAVTGCGETLAIDRKLVKDNAGFDLKNLLIGSEGTLAIITSATFRLVRPMAEQQTVLLGFDKLQDLMTCYSRLAKAVQLNAAEFFCHRSKELVGKAHNIRSSLEGDHAWYLLLEYDEGALADEALVQAGSGADAVLARSVHQAQQLWQWRELISSTIQPFRPYKQDLACHFTAMNEWLNELQQQVFSVAADLQLLLFGHLGDGNVHVNIVRPATMTHEAFVALYPRLDEIVVFLTRHFHATVSAEHGIGILKKSLLPAARTAEELAVYRRIKQVFDPDDILNPGKLL